MGWLGGRGSRKKQGRGGNCLKGGGGAKPVCRFNGGGGLVKNRGEGGFFEGRG